MDSGVMLVESNATEAQLRQLGPDATRYIFEVGDDQTTRGVFACVRRNLPQGPPLGKYRERWDALSDSIWDGLAAAHPEGGDAIVYWRDAHRMGTADGGTYDIAVQIFKDMSESLGDQKYNPAPLQLLVLLSNHSAKSH